MRLTTEVLLNVYNGCLDAEGEFLKTLVFIFLSASTEGENHPILKKKSFIPSSSQQARAFSFYKTHDSFSSHGVTHKAKTPKKK